MAVHLQMSSDLDGTHRGEVLREGGSKKSTPQGNLNSNRGTPIVNKGQRRSRREFDINYVEKTSTEINVFIKNSAVVKVPCPQDESLKRLCSGAVNVYCHLEKNETGRG